MGRDDLPAGGIRFTVPMLRGFVFRRYPIEVTPPDGLVGFINNSTWQTGAIFKDREWRNMRGKPFKQVPTHWTAMEKDLDAK